MELVKVEHVTKEYKLYKAEKYRFRALFSKRVKYTPKVAVNDVTFSVSKGEKVAIIGPNGAGKTTLLKMIMGLIYPTSGEIFRHDSITPLIEGMAGFDGGLTGRQNIVYRGSLLGYNGEKLDDYVNRVIEFAELGMYIEQPLRTYSGVMKGRLGYACNINVEPEVLIMDEVMAQGDGAFREKCLKRVGELVNRENSCFIFATHTPKIAKRFCERGIVMRFGVIEFDGPIDEAIEYYKEHVTAKEQSQTVEVRQDLDDAEDFFEDDF